MFLIRDGWLCISCALVFFLGTFVGIVVTTNSFENDPLGRSVFRLFFQFNIGVVFGMAGILLLAIFAGAVVIWLKTGTATLPVSSPIDAPASMQNVLTLTISAVFALAFSSVPMSIAKDSFETKNKADIFIRSKLRFRSRGIAKRINGFSFSVVGYLMIFFFGVMLTGVEFPVPSIAIAIAAISIFVLAVINMLSWLWVYSGLWLPASVLVLRLGR